MYPTVGPQQAPDIFQITPIYDRHPVHDYKVSFDDWGNVLYVALPFTQLLRFHISQFPMNTWVALQDGAGRPIPLTVFVDYRGAVMGKWL